MNVTITREKHEARGKKKEQEKRSEVRNKRELRIVQESEKHTNSLTSKRTIDVTQLVSILRFIVRVEKIRKMANSRTAETTWCQNPTGW